MTASNINLALIKTSLGSKFLAHRVAKRIQKKIPAYQKFLAQQGIQIPAKFADFPISDKHSYILPSSLEELSGDRLNHSVSLYRSSGSSGNAYYWSMLRSTNRFAIPATKFFLEKTFQIHKKKTLIIIAASLGSWLGGEHFSWTFKSLAQRVRYPLTVFTPGSNLEEIVTIIDQLNYFFEQIIILISPSFIPLLHHKAATLNLTLDLSKLKYLVTSEYFPESLRQTLRKKAQLPSEEVFMVSMYGSADTGGLGVESPASIAMRQLLEEYPDLREYLGIKLPLPIFFHSIRFDSYLEQIDQKFCITQWQGIPLLRYHLFDQVHFYSWKSLKKAILETELIDQDHPLRKVIKTANNFLFDVTSDMIAVSGRFDKTLILGGTNFSEAMLDSAIKSESLSHFLTGLYRAEILYNNEQFQLSLDLELNPNLVQTQAIEELIYTEIIQQLSKIQPEFAKDWQEIYQDWEVTSNKQILKLHFLPSPSLSNLREKMIKQSSLS
jgi:phenylacetate-CoA ligase